MEKSQRVCAGKLSMCYLFATKTKNKNVCKPISGQVDRASAAETVDTGLTPGRVKLKTIKIGILSFPA